MVGADEVGCEYAGRVADEVRVDVGRVVGRDGVGRGVAGRAEVAGCAEVAGRAELGVLGRLGAKSIKRRCGELFIML